MALLQIVVFPGLLFLSVISLVYEYVDRKLYARLQNRVGPPWYQPVADIIKLLTKEAIVPAEADSKLFRAIPALSFAAACAAFLYIPIWSDTSIYPFDSDIIVVLYFLTIPTITYFLAGWFSSSLFAELGAIRAMTQLFAYEVPLYMSMLAPALLANTWSVSGIAAYYHAHPLYLLANIPALIVALFAAQGKLERTPFDIPDAETEIVGGTFTEYSGRLLAMFKMAMNAELVVLAALISAVFFPLYLPGGAVVNFLLFFIKVFAVVFVLSVMRASLARFRLDQMISFCWKLLAPIALAQIVLDLVLKGVLH